MFNSYPQGYAGHTNPYYLFNVSDGVIAGNVLSCVPIARAATLGHFYIRFIVDRSPTIKRPAKIKKRHSQFNQLERPQVRAVGKNAFFRKYTRRAAGVYESYRYS